MIVRSERQHFLLQLQVRKHINTIVASPHFPTRYHILMYLKYPIPISQSYAQNFTILIILS